MCFGKKASIKGHNWPLIRTDIPSSQHRGLVVFAHTCLGGYGDFRFSGDDDRSSIAQSSSSVHASILRIVNLQRRFLASSTFVLFSRVALEFRVGHHKRVVAAVWI